MLMRDLEVQWLNSLQFCQKESDKSEVVCVFCLFTTLKDIWKLVTKKQKSKICKDSSSLTVRLLRTRYIQPAVPVEQTHTIC